MSTIDESMYRLTVVQRDAAWREVEAWKQRYEALTKVMVDHASLQRPPVMLADKESYEAGRVMERQAMLQLFTDPENQPTQHGTVTVEYMQREIAAEREACAKVCEEDAFVEQWKGLAEAARRIRARGQA